LIGVIDEKKAHVRVENLVAGPEKDLRNDTAEQLRTEVAAMNVDNFVVRPKRKLVETYAKPEPWVELSAEVRAELAHEVAGLPSELEAEPEEAKRFDLLMLRQQLAVLLIEPTFERLRDQMKEIAGLLEEKASIPMVREQLPLIQEIQTDEWWQDVTAPMLETVRKRLRLLVRLIEKARRQPVFVDFEDEIGGETTIALPGLTGAGDFERFRSKARAFLREHQDHPAVHKLRSNEQLTVPELEALEKLLIEGGIGGVEQINRAKEESHSFGLFIRSLVGLERDAAKRAFDRFLQGKTLNANQIEFINLIIDHLSEHGVMDPALLYESPFTDLTPKGPDGIFESPQVDELVSILKEIQDMALAA
jgi:type I restriction enzyme, R subunit